MSTTPRIEDVAFFKDAEPDLLERFRSRLVFTQHEPGTLVMDFDDASDDVFFVVSGTVRVEVRAANGREVILGDLGTGQFFGEMAALDAQPRSAAVTALHRSRLLRIAGATFVEMVTHSPVLAARLMRVFTARIRTGNARLVEHSALTSKFRLYAELLRLARPRAGTEDLVVTPPPVQQVLASRIGVRREAVSREMAELIRQGVLARTPTALLILRPDALRQAIDAELES